MKIALQYLNDAEGNIQAVQLPFTDWKRVMNKLKKYEQALRMKSDLQEGFDSIAAIKNQPSTKQTLTDFLNEL